MKLKQHRLVMTKLEVYIIRKMLKTILILFGISWVLFLIQYMFSTWYVPPPIINYLRPLQG